MIKTLLSSFLLLLIAILAAAQTSPIKPDVQVFYNQKNDETVVRLAAVKIAGDIGKYHSVHLSPYFTFVGRRPVIPEIVNFELQTVVKGRLSTDLYVVFVIDGEEFFLSSNRWAVKRPVPGRVWTGERLVFRMPIETFQKIAAARTFAIKFDGVKLPVGENERQALRAMFGYMKATPVVGVSNPR